MCPFFFFALFSVAKNEEAFHWKGRFVLNMRYFRYSDPSSAASTSILNWLDCNRTCTSFKMRHFWWFYTIMIMIDDAICSTLTKTNAIGKNGECCRFVLALHQKVRKLVTQLWKTKCTFQATLNLNENDLLSKVLLLWYFQQPFPRDSRANKIEFTLIMYCWVNEGRVRFLTHQYGQTQEMTTFSTLHKYLIKRQS